MEEKHFESNKDNYKKFEKNYVIVLLMFCMLKMEKYILLIFENITQIVKNNLFFQRLPWRKMTLSCTAKSPILLREITSKHHIDFYCLNCLYSFATKNKCEFYKKARENKDHVVMSSEHTKILEFN